MATDTNTLTPLQERFKDEYLLSLNATDAYKKAGYSGEGNVAEVNAHRLLRNAKVADAIQQAMAERAERTEVTADKVVEGFAAIAFTDMRDVLEWTGNSVTLKSMDDIPASAHAAIAEIHETTTKDGSTTIRIKMHSKVAALDSLGKHLGMFKEPPGDDNARKTLDALVKLFSKRNESGDGHVIDVPVNEQPSTTRALIEGCL